VGASCRTSCASNADCAANYQCNTATGVCLLVNGQPCTSPSQCVSGHCLQARVGSLCSALARCPGGKVIDPTGTHCI
jgi:hypothetical protein